MSSLSVNRFVFCAAITVVLLVVACAKNDSEEHGLKSEEYYRYKAGNIREYDMDSTHYDQGTGTAKKYYFLIRENVTDSFTDLSGRAALRIEQYISRDSGKNYYFYALHAISKDNFGMQRVENNQRYLKVAIPIVDKKKWNGNLFNNLGEQDFQYSGVFQPYPTKYSKFTDCIAVTELNDSSVISSDKKMSVYASDTGMVYKMDKSLRYYPGDKVGGYVVEWHLRKFWVK